jgi:hypothetical protein
MSAALVTLVEIGKKKKKKNLVDQINQSKNLLQLVALVNTSWLSRLNIRRVATGLQVLLVSRPESYFRSFF